MSFHIGIESNVEGRSMGWALEHPGCFAYGASDDLALAAMPKAIWGYAEWIASHNKGETWLDPSEVELYLEETWQVYSIDENFDLTTDGYEVNAWFLHDWKPLTAEDVERALKLLSWCRDDLLDTVHGLGPAALDARYPNERWSIAGILKHVGGAEWWYLDRLGLVFPRDQVPEDPFERLEAIRQHLVETLPSLVDSRQVLGVDGEFWSPRKLLRRAVWHERDHTVHIRKLLSR